MKHHPEMFYCFKEFEESGDPERHYESLLSLAKEGVEKGKVQYILFERSMKFLLL